VTSATWHRRPASRRRRCARSRPVDCRLPRSARLSASAMRSECRCTTWPLRGATTCPSRRSGSGHALRSSPTARSDVTFAEDASRSASAAAHSHGLPAQPRHRGAQPRRPVNLAATPRRHSRNHTDRSPSSASGSDETDNTQERPSLGAAGPLHPAASGRCPHPAGPPPGPTGAGVKVVRPRPPAPACCDGQMAVGGLRARHLDRVGLPPAAPRRPPGEGAGAPTASRSATAGSHTNGGLLALAGHARRGTVAASGKPSTKEP
jgi:hypothetical protein